MSDALDAVASKFSFAAILIGDLLQGTLFLAINGPILYAIFWLGVVPRSLLDGYKMVAARGFAHVASGDSQVLILGIFGVLCFTTSQMLNPVAKTAGIVVGKLLAMRGFSGYTSYNISAPTYPGFVARLIRDPVAKGHWEWELFMFYQRRAATVTFSVWIILLIWIRWVHWGPYFRPTYALEVVIALFIFLGTIRTAIEGSKVMRRTHDLYTSCLPEMPYTVPAQTGARSAGVH